MKIIDLKLIFLLCFLLLISQSIFKLFILNLFCVLKVLLQPLIKHLFFFITEFYI